MHQVPPGMRRRRASTPERRKETPGGQDLKVPLSFDEEEDLRDAERIEEEELFFGEREKAPSKKRRER